MRADLRSDRGCGERFRNVGREGLAGGLSQRNPGAADAGSAGRGSGRRGGPRGRRPEIRSRRTFCRVRSSEALSRGGLPRVGRGPRTHAGGSGRELPRRPEERRRPEMCFGAQGSASGPPGGRPGNRVSRRDSGACLRAGRGQLPQDSATGAAAPGMPTRGACPVPREPGIHAREGRNADAGNAGGTQAGAADSGGSRPRHPPRETRETARGRSRLGPGSGTHARGETSTPKSSGKRPKLRSSAPLRACLCRGTGRGARPKICFGARASEFRACRGATGGRVSRL